MTLYLQDQLFELFPMAVSEIRYLVGLSSYKLLKNFGLSHKSPTTTKIGGDSKLNSLITNLKAEIKYLMACSRYLGQMQVLSHTHHSNVLYSTMGFGERNTRTQ